MGNHKRTRSIPGGPSAATSAAVALGVVVTAVALGGCSGSGTAQARPAAESAATIGAPVTLATAAGYPAYATVVVRAGHGN